MIYCMYIIIYLIDIHVFKSIKKIEKTIRLKLLFNLYDISIDFQDDSKFPQRLNIT